jgi:putative transposase
MEEAREKIEAWRIDYNESRPHQALQEETPAQFAMRTRELERSMSFFNRRKLTLDMVRETQAVQTAEN